MKKQKAEIICLYFNVSDEVEAYKKAKNQNHMPLNTNFRENRCILKIYHY